MANFKLCQQDPLVDVVRKQLGCNPVLRPSTRTKLLNLLVVKNSKTENIGPIKRYLKEELIFPPDLVELDLMIDFAGRETMQVSLDFGVQLLSRFTDLNAEKEEALKAHFSGKEQVVFSFEEVEIWHVPLVLLREELRKNRMDTVDSIFVKKNWLGQPEYKFYVISKVITSKKINFKILSKEGFNSSAQVQANFVDANLSLSHADQFSLKLEHYSSTALTFAFACHRLIIQENGKLFPMIEAEKVAPLSFNDQTENHGGPVLLTTEPELIALEPLDE